MYDAASLVAAQMAIIPTIQSTAYPTDYTPEPKSAEDIPIDYSSVQWGNITGDIKDQKDLLKSLQDVQAQIEESITQQLGTVFEYKGQVATEEDLPEDAESGDCYNVTKTGANYLFNGETWDKLSESYDFSAFATKDEIEELVDLFYTKTEIEDLINNLEEIIDNKLVEKVDLSAFENYQETIDSEVSNQNGNIQALMLQMGQMQQMINELKSLDPEIVVLYDGHDTEYINEERDYALSGAITQPLTIDGRNVILQDATITAANFQAIAIQDISIKDVTIEGTLAKSVSNYLLSVKCNGHIIIRDCIINPTSAYNGIEIGLNNYVPKSVTIDDVDFTGHLSNNGISIFGMAENGVVTISNCRFEDLSNVLRISNRLNMPFTINIINCVCEKWETGQYAGAILLQDYTSTSIEDANNNDIFSKITINIQNLTKPDGTKLTMPEDLSTICGTRDDNQIIYMYDSWRGHVAYGDKYPVINIV